MKDSIIDDIAEVLVDLSIKEANDDTIRVLANILIDLKLLGGGK